MIWRRVDIFYSVTLLFSLLEPQGDLSGCVSGSKAHETVGSPNNAFPSSFLTLLLAHM